MHPHLTPHQIPKPSSYIKQILVHPFLYIFASSVSIILSKNVLLSPTNSVCNRCSTNARTCFFVTLSKSTSRRQFWIASTICISSGPLLPRWKSKVLTGRIAGSWPIGERAPPEKPIWLCDCRSAGEGAPILRRLSEDGIIIILGRWDCVCG